MGTWRSRPRRMLLGVVPALLVLLVVGSAWVVLLLHAGDVAVWATPFAADWTDDAAGAARTLLRLGLAVLLVLGSGFLATVMFTALTLAVGDPFYARIWAATERELGGDVPDTGPGWWRALRDSAVLLGVGAATGLGVLVLGLLPVLGAVAGTAVGLTVSSWLLAGELLGRPLEARGHDRRARAELLRAHRPEVLGFGLAVQACFLVPLGAVATMPAAVVGATTLAREVLGEAGTPPAARR